jgi:outer membrane protein OmpA-like peptidoglycan-associated protein
LVLDNNKTAGMSVSIRVSSRVLYRRLVFPLFCALIFFLNASDAVATSGQFGDTGLFSQPRAQTLNEGNICVGLWANCYGLEAGENSTKSDSGVIAPATITMGLGTFMEAFGSYPNLLFNGDGDASARGYANAGFKFRVLGQRSSPFRLAFDVQGRRSISEDPNFDGLTDYITRVMGTMKLKNSLGFHVNAGYAFNDSPDGLAYDDQVLVGGGVEYSLATRLRIIAEYYVESEKIEGFGEESEATLGFQYLITPHLTLNLAGSVGLSDASPDWRVLFGLTTCQGIGTYNRPVPKLVSPEDIEDEPVEPIKVRKIRFLTPLLSKIPVPASPINRLEVAVYDPEKAIVVNPSDRLTPPKVNPLEASPFGPNKKFAQAEDTVLPDQPFPAKIRRSFRLEDLSFSPNQWDLSAEGRESISMVAEELRKENKYFIISIEGHTDDVGSEAYNKTLSFKRAVTVATHLVLRDGFDPGRIFVQGYGESRPIADNNTAEGRSKNRRVEILILVPEGYEGIVLKGGGPSEPQEPIIDRLSIEQAIMEKIGREAAKPTGTFGQVDAEE